MRTPIASPMPWRVATASCNCASLRALAKATDAGEAKIHPVVPDRCVNESVFDEYMLSMPRLSRW
ncbi:hypothetical protein [Saccharopolyspora sp. NFXS83]|uniref:hypothetical protein n=1 Tax=Saccharopolyspora sp. NFXS83 TaxID=2993560 RepID=UPI00224A5FC5|nr:hypothetical protein [Saccharopolyspora sp. NFXS83]